MLVGLAAAQAPETLWTRTYGDTASQVGYSVQQTSDRGFIIAGYTKSRLYWDPLLIKTDSLGNLEWQRVFEHQTSLTEEAYSVVQTADGGYIITGVYDDEGLPEQQLWLAKTDANGWLRWSVKLGGNWGTEEGRSVRQRSDGGYIITGLTCVYGAGGPDVWLVKTDSVGGLHWHRTYGTSSSEEGYSVRETFDGGYIIAGTRNYRGYYTAWLVKTNVYGQLQWDKMFWGSWQAHGAAVEQTPDGGYVLAGYTYSQSCVMKALLVRTDANGDTCWTRAIGGPGLVIGQSVLPLLEGGYLVAGFTLPLGADSCDVWLCGTDDVGNVVWESTIGGDRAEYGYELAATTDGGVAVVGATSSSGAGKSDVYLVRFGRVGGVAGRESPGPRALPVAAPNPFRFEARIRCVATGNGPVDVWVYDGLGRRVRLLCASPTPDGSAVAVWDGRDNAGRVLPPGVYYGVVGSPGRREPVRLVKTD